MKRLTLTLILLLLATPAWSMSAAYRHLEPETVTYQSLPSSTQAQFTTNENIKSIKYGSGITLSALTANLSLVNGTAFVTSPSVDLRPYLGFKGTWSDVGTAGVGFFGAAGTGEQLTEKNADTGFDTDAYWTKGAGWTVALSKAVATAAVNTLIYRDQALLSGGSLYRTVFTVGALSSGGVRFYFDGGVTPLAGTTRTANGTYTQYVTANTGNVNLCLQTFGATTANVDDYLVGLVTSPSATGTTITATKGGVQNWTTQGTTPNAASFSVVITKN